MANVSSVPDKIEGVSIVPLLQGKIEAFNRKNDLVFHFPHYGKGPIQVPQSAILAGRWKLIKWYDTGYVKLFDLLKDIGETTDLSKLNSEKRAEMRQRRSGKANRQRTRARPRARGRQ